MSFKFNPFTGTFDLEGEGVASGTPEVRQLDRIATEAISALNLVKADSPTHVSKAFNNGTAEDAEVLGLALNGAPIGGTVSVLLVGPNTDLTHVGFVLNKPLFLGVGGALTDVPPAGAGIFRTLVGKALGNDQIYVNISEPIELA